MNGHTRLVVEFPTHKSHNTCGSKPAHDPKATDVCNRPSNVPGQPFRQELWLDRQHGVPLLLASRAGGAVPLKPLSEPVSETYIQALVHEHPACLPIAE